MKVLLKREETINNYLDDDGGEGYDLEGVEWEEGWDKKDDKGP